VKVALGSCAKMRRSSGECALNEITYCHYSLISFHQLLCTGEDMGWVLAGVAFIRAAVSRSKPAIVNDAMSLITRRAEFHGLCPWVNEKAAI
jgi:hypothetical protein